MAERIDLVMLKLSKYRKLANIKRKDSIASDMSGEWHAEITQEAAQDPDKLKAYVQEEAFLCF